MYDLISTIGNVGGTLGLFIGFSFSGFISIAINIFMKAIDFIEIQAKNKINSKEITIVQESPKEGNQIHHEIGFMCNYLTV